MPHVGFRGYVLGALARCWLLDLWRGMHWLRKVTPLQGNPGVHEQQVSAIYFQVLLVAYMPYQA